MISKSVALECGGQCSIAMVIRTTKCLFIIKNSVQIYKLCFTFHVVYWANQTSRNVFGDKGCSCYVVAIVSLAKDNMHKLAVRVGPRNRLIEKH